MEERHALGRGCYASVERHLKDREKKGGKQRVKLSESLYLVQRGAPAIKAGEKCNLRVISLFFLDLELDLLICELCYFFGVVSLLFY